MSGTPCIIRCAVTDHALTSFLFANNESDALDALISCDFGRDRFQSAVLRLHILFGIQRDTSPAPLPAPGLIVTQEIRTQCERYLPITGLAAVFRHLYSAALTYPPILSSTPFHNSLSWADTFVSLPEQFQFSPNPALLLESLLVDRSLLLRFLFASFLPNRFYGAIGRYPGQRQFVRDWLLSRKERGVYCLDAACGTGEETYGLALLLADQGFLPEEVQIAGWTLEPLEVWAAAHRRFPHDRPREAIFREATSSLIHQGYGRRIAFHCHDILKSFSPSPITHENSSPARDHRRFDLILCNGLLGGPIVHDNEQLKQAADNLSGLLAPGGILLAADNFHGGWKQKCPQSGLRALFEKNGLITFVAGEGVGALKPD